jgi:iron(III) transport system permease protein
MVWSRLLLLLVVAPLLCAPVAVVLLSWLQWNPQSAEILREMQQSVLPAYWLTTLQLSVMVGFGVALMGVGAATMVALFDFKGRRFFEWTLLLPMAMPAYVMAYAYTDFFQFSGPFQTFARSVTGWEGRVFPEIRSLWGAAMVFTFALYPYTYLLARAALVGRAPQLMEAARLLGASLPRRIGRVALPMIRPAVMAGVALALMETLADYGVSSYFGIQTFTAGIYKAWLSMDNPVAASQLATLLLLLVLVLVWWERRARQRSRYAVQKGGRSESMEAQPIRLSGGMQLLAWVLCLVPLLGGFVVPVLAMLRPLLNESVPIPWQAFFNWSRNSFLLAGLAAVLSAFLALLLASLQRQKSTRLSNLMNELVGLGYAVPGAVAVVGLLLPLAWIQTRFPNSTAGYWLTGTWLGLLWAYLTRFTAVAMHSVQGGLAQIPKSLDESSRMLGISGWRMSRRVHWPLLSKTTLAAAILVFVDVMKELPATLVLRPFNFDTLAVVAYQLARDERLGEAALPSLALVLVGMIPVALLSRTLRR